ncbi:MAG: phosphate ABC transporter substrate-binding protein, partial [Bacillota bacterium]|nr:phosphate ABC transporter substrate-binding protein [Bacillota bacterium]
KIINKKFTSMFLVGILAVGLFAGCDKEADNQTEEKYLSIVGSTSVTPVVTKLADAYMAKNDGVKIDVQGIGSSAGVKAAYDKSADIGMSSRNLKEAEKEWGLTETTIAFDGIAVSVHPSNTITKLTTEQVKDIFEGSITNWSEIGGKDEEIIVVSREDGSGTRGAFEGLVALVAEDADGNKYSTLVGDALIADGNGAVKANIASKENAIGYLSFSYLDESVKTLSINDVEPLVENIENGTYEISRPFLLLTNDAITDLANEFIEYILSVEGQKIIAEKLIPVK